MIFFFLFHSNTRTKNYNLSFFSPFPSPRIFFKPFKSHGLNYHINTWRVIKFHRKSWRKKEGWGGRKKKKEKFRGSAKCEKDTINSRVCHVAADTTISVRRRGDRGDKRSWKVIQSARGKWKKFLDRRREICAKIRARLPWIGTVRFFAPSPFSPFLPSHSLSLSLLPLSPPFFFLPFGRTCRRKCP